MPHEGGLHGRTRALPASERSPQPAPLARHLRRPERRAAPHARLQRPDPHRRRRHPLRHRHRPRRRLRSEGARGHHAQPPFVHRGGRRPQPPPRRRNVRGQDRDAHHVALPLRPRRRPALLQELEGLRAEQRVPGGDAPRHGHGPRPPQAVLRPSPRLRDRHGRHRDRARRLGAVDVRPHARTPEPARGAAVRPDDLQRRRHPRLGER